MRPLEKGDIVDVVAPSSDCSKDEFLEALAYLEALGLVPRYDIDFRKSKKYIANEDDFRASDLRRALYANDSKAVWCLRGGYGALRLLPYIEKWKKTFPQKLFIGLSDISILHYCFYKKFGSVGVHGPLLYRMAKDASSKEIKEMKSLLFKGITAPVEHRGIKPFNSIAEHTKLVSGTLVGGNLCSLASMGGTSFTFDAKSKIVFLEEVGERGYQIDRLLTQLRLASSLEKAKAIVFGDFTGGDERDGKNYVSYALKKFANEVNLPVFKGLRSGHGKIQLPILLGAKARIEFRKNRDFNFYNG